MKMKKKILRFEELPRNLKMRGKIRGWIESEKIYSTDTIIIRPGFVTAGDVFGVPIAAEISDCHFAIEEVAEVKTELGTVDMKLFPDIPDTISIAGYDKREINDYEEEGK